MKSEMKMPRDRDREVKCQQNSQEFSRNETLAGYWSESVSQHPSDPLVGAVTSVSDISLPHHHHQKRTKDNART